MSETRIAPRTIYQVSEVADILGGLLEDSLPRLWVQGEVSNFVRPASGHWYFTLKDAGAQLRCVMFKGSNFSIRPQPRDGDSVLVRGSVALYAARGDLQLICEHLEAAGEGALLRAFEQLKARLAAEGLFDEKLKRPLPRAPRAIGLITSATGAAVQDVRSALARRYPLCPVYLYPVPVQGNDAPPAIIQALRELPRRAPVDVILLVRGGGSLEDLWAFNDESLARAIRACTVPVVTGVGHEIDTTIADYAADLRAPTPTAAAELASPDMADWRTQIEAGSRDLGYAMQERLQAAHERLRQLAHRLQLLHPQRRLRDTAQRLDELSLRLQQSQRQQLQRTATHVRHLGSRLAAAAPLHAVRLRARQVEHLHARLHTRMQLGVQTRQAQLARADALLASLNPRAVLQRGYAIALRADGSVVSDARTATPGETLRVQLAQGALDTTITHIHPSIHKDNP